MYQPTIVEDLIGKVITDINGSEGDSCISFTTESGEVYEMYHAQECCESVTLEDVIGSWDDLIGHKIVDAYVSTNNDTRKKENWLCNSFLWTFYTITSDLGTVTLRWYGESNGYYSERVEFIRIK